MISGLFEKLYYRSPIFFQNIAISLYGLKLKLNRNSGDYHKYLAEYSTHLGFSKEEVDDYSLKKLREILEVASEKVPYYRRFFSETGFSLQFFSTIEDIKKIPLLDKETLRKESMDFINESYINKSLTKIGTTGSTGTPLSVYCNANVRQRNYAVYDRFLSQVGIAANKRKATLGGRILIPSDLHRPPYWRYSFFQRNLLMSSYHLSDETIPLYIEKLRKFFPHYIDSYPSSIYMIADYAERYGIDIKGLTTAITTSGETLHDAQREVIEKKFGVHVYDQYGSAEMCVFISQCSHGTYHVNNDFGLVEFLDDKGESAMPGEEAEIVCTGFINDVMPLIRYRIGDRALVGDSVPCACGSPFPKVKALLGRNDDVIVTPEGMRVGRLSPVLKGFPVKEAQYVQDCVSKVRVLLVSSEGYTAETEANFILELRKRLGQSISIEIEYVDYIERGKGAKFKSIISRIP